MNTINHSLIDSEIELMFN